MGTPAQPNLWSYIPDKLSETRGHPAAARVPAQAESLGVTERF